MDAMLTLDGSRNAELTALLLFSRSGFTKELRALAAGRADVQLIGLDRLYGGG